MNRKITILGCGYLGTALAKKCLAMQWDVSALTRNSETATILRNLGVGMVVECEIADQSWHAELVPEQDFVVTCVGAASRSVQGYQDSYLHGQSSAIQWVKSGSVGSYLFTSSTSVYPQGEGEWIDETSSNDGCSPRAQVLLDAEKMSFPINDFSTRSYILRLSGIYGPDRHVLINKIKKGEIYDGNRDRILNLIHRDDAVDAILKCLQSGEQNKGGVYNVSDGRASTRGEITDWLSVKLGLAKPRYLENDTGQTPNRKISNQKILNDIDWKPNFPSYQEGYNHILNQS